MCANMAGSLLLVGSADGSLTLVGSKLGDSDGSSSNVALHDMWAGTPCLLSCSYLLYNDKSCPAYTEIVSNSIDRGIANVMLYNS